MIRFKLICSILCAIFLSVCQDNDETAISKDTIESNRFVSIIMNFYYLWEDQDLNIDYKKHTDTYKIIETNSFDKLKALIINNQ